VDSWASEQVVCGMGVLVYIYNKHSKEIINILGWLFLLRRIFFSFGGEMYMAGHDFKQATV